MRRTILLLALSLAACSGCKNTPEVQVPSANVRLENLKLPVMVYFRGLPSPAVQSLNLAIEWWHRVLVDSPLCANNAELNLCQKPLFQLTNDPDAAFITVAENYALPINVRAVATSHYDGKCTVELGPDWLDGTVIDALGRCVGLDPRSTEIQTKGQTQ